MSTSIAPTLWRLTIPLHITHASTPSSSSSDDPKPPPPFITTIPRFSYLALLLPRLRQHFSLPCSSFHHEEVELRNLTAGLLIDLYRPTILPWRLVVGDGGDWDIRDTFINGCKEADFVRNGSGKHFMGLSKGDTEAVWCAVKDQDYTAFARVNKPLLNTPTPLKHVPLRIYVPSSPPGEGVDVAAVYKVVQGLVPPRLESRQPQTLGVALRGLLPSLFPSSRDPVLAQVIMHGAPVPFTAPLEELMREAAYPDGWLCLVVVLL